MTTTRTRRALSPQSTRRAKIRTHIDFLVPRCEPHLSEEPDWSLALYFNPPSHDFCTWLITAELMRREHQAPAPLKVTLLFNQGQLGTYDFGNVGLMAGQGGKLGLPVLYSNAMVAHVLRPAISMIGAVNEPDMHTPVQFGVIKNQCEYGYFPFPLVDAARAGYEIPRWNVPEWAKREALEFLKGERPVVITLRETNVQPQRNSQVDEWMKFADSIEKDFPVLFIRDTMTANFPLGKWRTWHRASTDVRIRAALYEQAYCNLMVGGGPAMWCSFSKSAPYLFFKQLTPVLGEWPGGTAAGWEEQAHLRVGESWPWAAPNQRITWRDDTFDAIAEEFESFLQRGKRADDKRMAAP